MIRTQMPITSLFIYEGSDGASIHAWLKAQTEAGKQPTDIHLSQEGEQTAVVLTMALKQEQPEVLPSDV